MNTDVEIRPTHNHDEYLAALRVRVAVFVEEQNGPADEEPDRWDDTARHFVVVTGGAVVGTGRLYHPEFRLAKIGRVALLMPFRGRGWATSLMATMISQARALAMREVILDAQAYAEQFYQRFGFQAEGELFLDAGIPHRRMRLPLR